MSASWAVSTTPSLQPKNFNIQRRNKMRPMLQAWRTDIQRQYERKRGRVVGREEFALMHPQKNRSQWSRDMVTYRDARNPLGCHLRWTSFTCWQRAVVPLMRASVPRTRVAPGWRAALLGPTSRELPRLDWIWLFDCLAQRIWYWQHIAKRQRQNSGASNFSCKAIMRDTIPLCK